MPKRSASARGGAQRSKPKTQKNFELVRPVSEKSEAETVLEETPSIATSTLTSAAPEAAVDVQPPSRAKEVAAKEIAEAPRSASARLAARRQAAQRAQQRSAAALITTEHFAYVRRDLVTIAILACLMFAIIIVSYIVLVVNAGGS